VKFDVIDVHVMKLVHYRLYENPYSESRISHNGVSRSLIIFFYIFRLTWIGVALNDIHVMPARKSERRKNSLSEYHNVLKDTTAFLLVLPEFKDRENYCCSF